MANVYEHVTADTKARILKVLTRRWQTSITSLDHTEQRKLASLVPELTREHYRDDVA
ncbi:hypothetical protein F4561_001474 [Lipingzhangella halophila]|uniref:Uncharacterized protein n=1 Tax=Lipingzhangella halophila TaxID=1783352 RepID=A0A7W7REX9_9ACTN|nr:hypothetical protein [Lipingzhangella halophila]MBB4930654.1 hypothetical protein [Lipingzhangella halophila]